MCNLTPSLATTKAQIEADALATARKASEDEVNRYSQKAADSIRDLQAMERKLATAQKAEADAVARERKVAEKERELDLTIERRVSASVTDIRNQANLDAAANTQLKIAEKDEQLASLNRTIEDLRRKAEQGSQQTQGEAQETVLEETLRAAFPSDEIAPVPKGQFGADCIQTVVGPSGKVGLVLWESKRTKVFTAGWLPKLREDQRNAKADVSILVTQVMPAGCKEEFILIDDGWVIQWKHVVQFTFMVRYSLIALAGAATANEGIETKAKTVYRYLTGARFKQRVQAILEKSTALKEGLDKERTAMTRIWAQRESLIAGVVDATAGMYGDLQGIAGKGLAEVEGLQLQGLDGGNGGNGGNGNA